MAMELTAADLRRYPGTYRNGESRVEITARAGKLYLKRGAQEAALAKLGEGHFATEGAATEYIFVAGADGRTEYVFGGGRALARQ